jgi:hypothetical protein
LNNTFVDLNGVGNGEDPPPLGNQGDGNGD